MWRSRVLSPMAVRVLTLVPVQVLRDISDPDDGIYSFRDPMETRLSYVRWQMDNILSDPTIKVSMLGSSGARSCVLYACGMWPRSCVLHACGLWPRSCVLHACGLWPRSCVLHACGMWPRSCVLHACGLWPRSCVLHACGLWPRSCVPILVRLTCATRGLARRLCCTQVCAVRQACGVIPVRLLVYV